MSTMKTASVLIIAFGCSAACFKATAQDGNEKVLYREEFPGGQNVTATGWHVAWTGKQAPEVSIVAEDGAPTSSTATAGNTQSLKPGHLLAKPGEAGQTLLYWTEAKAINPLQWGVLGFRWRQCFDKVETNDRNTPSYPCTFPAVRIGRSWYSTYGGWTPSIVPNGKWEEKSIWIRGNMRWSKWNLDADTLKSGDGSDWCLVPPGTITAFGLMSFPPGLQRLDAFEVFASGPRTSPVQNAVTPGKLLIERPTLICLGFQWYVSGDDNINAKATVQYRKAGDREWKPALDMWSIHGQRCFGYDTATFYEPPHMFAGSIFDLKPGTEYECRLTIVDPDGIEGEAVRTVKVSTRMEPQPPTDSRVFHLGGGTKDFADFRTAVRALNAGDTLSIHKGTYRLAAKGDAGYLDNNVFNLDLQGTEERPITIKAAGDGEVVFDAQANYMLFDVQNSQHLIIDGLTMKNTDFAIYAGSCMPASNDGISVRHCTYDNIGRPIQGFMPALTDGVAKTIEHKPSDGRIRHVGGASKKVDGNAVNPVDGGLVFKTLRTALFGNDSFGGCYGASLKAYDLVRPGDTIIVHKGETLFDHSKKSHWGPCYFYNSAIILNLKGTADKPITIRGEG